jgi:hypothetical protein
MAAQAEQMQSLWLEKSYLLNGCLRHKTASIIEGWKKTVPRAAQNIS